MSNYKVTLTLVNGETTSYLTEGANVKMVSQAIESKYGDSQAVKTYAIESTQKTLPPEAMQGLMNATFGLIACIVVLIYAEYRIRKWLRG